MYPYLDGTLLGSAALCLICVAIFSVLKDNRTHIESLNASVSLSNDPSDKGEQHVDLRVSPISITVHVDL